MRRNLHRLLDALKSAKGTKAKALAHYQLALFHDNNSREPEAIPHYRKAIRCGLSGRLEAMARAWLASSLCKTGDHRGAAKECGRALKMACDPKLLKFLRGLQGRIDAHD
ncbi:MAG TPA: hypothetical protein VGI03_02270 [Verrucomicrobiae bacterium]|jgi:hypothetical protein